MKILIHTLPRSGSKAIQYTISRALDDPRKFSLREFFNYHYRYKYCKVFNFDRKNWDDVLYNPLNSVGEWASYDLSDSGKIFNTLIPAVPENWLSFDQFIVRQLDLLDRCSETSFVAKIFDSEYEQCQDKLFQINSRFDHHVILRRDPLDTFLSTVVSEANSNWNAIGKLVDLKRVQVKRREYESFIKSLNRFERMIKLIPNPQEVFLTDQAFKIENLTIKIPNRIEYGVKKLDLIENLDEVKSWFRS